MVVRSHHESDEPGHPTDPTTCYNETHVMPSIIVAMSENGVIGRDGDLPWKLSSDLKRFKTLTMGHHLIMGRKTWDSIGRPLPGRTSVVISRTQIIENESVLTARSIEGAIRMCGDDPEPFVIGGGQIYELAMPLCDTIYLTIVHATIDGDTVFNIDWSLWNTTSEATIDADDRNEYSHTNRKLKRI